MITEDVLDRISIYREMLNPNWPTIMCDVKHGVHTRYLMRMRDRAPSALVCPVELVRLVLLLKTHRTVYLVDSFITKEGLV